MITEKIYYKICYSHSVILFYHDMINDRLDGIIEEGKTEEKLIIKKHLSVSCYENVVNNSLAMAMIRKGKRITQEEYDSAYAVVDAMINSDDWLIADNEIAPKKIVTETVYV